MLRFLKFIEYLIEIRTFLISQKSPSLNCDEKWSVKLMFPANITTHQNKLNLCLHGPRQTMMSLFEI